MGLMFKKIIFILIGTVMDISRRMAKELGV